MLKNSITISLYSLYPNSTSYVNKAELRFIEIIIAYFVTKKSSKYTKIQIIIDMKNIRFKDFVLFENKECNHTPP